MIIECGNLVLDTYMLKQFIGLALYFRRKKIKQLRKEYGKDEKTKGEADLTAQFLKFNQ
jgi:hypothetical protein